MGCTEITMLISQEDFDLPVFDTTRIHAEAAIDFAHWRMPGLSWSQQTCRFQQTWREASVTFPR
jgi:hypothetical protein